MGKTNKTYKSKKEMQDILEKRFDYLSKDEKNKLVYGDTFVKVPSRELKRLRIEVYPYLM